MSLVKRTISVSVMFSWMDFRKTWRPRRLLNARPVARVMIAFFMRFLWLWVMVKEKEPQIFLRLFLFFRCFENLFPCDGVVGSKDSFVTRCALDVHTT